WIGVSIRGITPELARGFGLERPRGALVAQVVDGGPASKAGLEPGDIIVGDDGREIEDASQLPLRASFAGVGKKAEIEVPLDAKVRGAFVLRVFPMSAAAEAGIQQGDVIIEANGKPVRTAAQFVEVVRKTKRGEVLKLLVRRGKDEVFTPIVKP